MSRSRALLLAVLVTAGEARGMSPSWGKGASSIEECDARLRRVESVTNWACYYQLAVEHRDLVRPIARQMEGILKRRPGEPYPSIVLAAMHAIEGRDEDPDPLDEYRSAQAEFRWRGDLEGEFLATTAIMERSAWIEIVQPGWDQFPRALELAEKMRDPEATAYALGRGAELAIAGFDFGRAERLLHQAQANVDARAQWFVPWGLFHLLGRTYAATARPLQAMEAFDRAAELTKDHPVWRELTATSRAETAVRLASADLLPMGEAETRLEESLALARADRHKNYMTGGEIPTLLLRAALRGPTQDSLETTRDILAREEQYDQEYLINVSLRLLSRFVSELDPGHPEQAQGYADRLLSIALNNQSVPDLALAHLARAHVAWRAHDRPALGREASAVLDTVDRIRWSQPEGLVRARTSADWAFAYELLAGWMLDLSGPAPVGSEVDEGLATIERLRGRVLLDELVRAGVSAGAPRELEDRRRQLLSGISRAQRLLVTPDAGHDARAAAETELRVDEATLIDLDDTIARSSPTAAPVPVASRQALQQALRDDEALLSFQLWRPDLTLRAPYPEGRSWLVVLTRRDAFAVRVLDAHRLEPKLGMFRAVVEAQGASEPEAGGSLGQALLGGALERLGPGIRSLSVVPDGALHALPLEMVRQGGHALGERYLVSTVPSASLWLRWRQEAPPARGPALALADPQASSAPGVQRDAARWLESLQLPSLPHARDEASAMVGALGRGGAIRLGADASERFLKTTDLRPWGVLHFATHAVVDETEPDRSALVLAPGSADEDGLLQPREIARLDLKGKVVVLSACRTASGHLVASEGAYGLVRAFFRAGADAVLASPWPIGDADAQQLIDELAARLGAGQTLGNALAGAKRARREAGAPTRVWAGLQLYGDANVVPHPVAGRRWAAFGLSLAALVLVVWMVRRLRRRASLPPRGQA